jgi:hypothetical protein
MVKRKFNLVRIRERLDRVQRGAKRGSVREPPVEDSRLSARDRDGSEAVDVCGENNRPP